VVGVAQVMILFLNLVQTGGLEVVALMGGLEMLAEPEYLTKAMPAAVGRHKQGMAAAVGAVVQVLQEAQQLLQPVELVGMEYHHPLLELQ